MKINTPAYSIYVGNGELKAIKRHIKNFYYGEKIFVISDVNVSKIYEEKLISLLDGYEVSWITIAPGEQSKSFDTYMEVVDKLLDLGIKRNHFILAFGGGVVGDLAGFIAATLFRGISYIQIPTSLLAMVDSSIGSKTAINIKQGKNLIGSFYSPKCIIIDTSLLKTLPESEYKEGIVEIIKAGIVARKSLYYRIIDTGIVTDDEIIDAIKVKKKLVTIDPYDHHERLLLNFGHTFGHAIELASNYQISHGIAVAYGILMELEIGIKQGKSSNIYNEVLAAFKRFNIIDTPLDYHDYLKYITHDKKNLDQGLKFIYVEDIGKAYVGNTKIDKIPQKENKL